MTETKQLEPPVVQESMPWPFFVMGLMLLFVLALAVMLFVTGVREQRRQTEQQNKVAEELDQRRTKEQLVEIQRLDTEIAEQKAKLAELDQWIIDNTTPAPKRDEYGREIPRSNP